MVHPTRWVEDEIVSLGDYRGIFCEGSEENNDWINEFVFLLLPNRSSLRKFCANAVVRLIRCSWWNTRCHSLHWEKYLSHLSYCTHLMSIQFVLKNHTESQSIIKFQKPRPKKDHREEISQDDMIMILWRRRRSKEVAVEERENGMNLMTDLLTNRPCTFSLDRKIDWFKLTSEHREG